MRATETVKDIAQCNDFDMFMTFTFRENRFDVDAKKRQMAYWLNNQRIIHGKFKYLIVPEYHKDGKALHFHALFAGYAGNLVDSGHRQHGRIVYNVKSYQAGFTTAVKIDDIQKVSSYIAKYLTKDMPKFAGKHRYWASQKLKRPLRIINPLLSAADEAEFKQDFETTKKVVFELKGDPDDYTIARWADFGNRRTDDLWVAELHPDPYSPLNSTSSAVQVDSLTDDSPNPETPQVGG